MTEEKGKELVRGLTGTRGIVTCKVRIIEEGVTDKLKGVKSDECLVASKLDPDQNKWLEIAAGFIQNTGGPNCHGNQFAKAWNAVHPQNIKVSISSTIDTKQADDVDGRYATETLKDGQVVVLDGYVGDVVSIDDGEEFREKVGAVYEAISNDNKYQKYAAKYG